MSSLEPFSQQDNAMTTIEGSLGMLSPRSPEGLHMVSVAGGSDGADDRVITQSQQLSHRGMAAGGALSPLSQAKDTDSKHLLSQGASASVDPATTMAESLNVPAAPEDRLLESFGHTATMRTYQKLTKACNDIIDGKGKQAMGRVEKLEANMASKKAAHAIKAEVEGKLVEINREQDLKECLSEHQMYAHGS